MTSPHHPNGSKPRLIGKYVSVSDAARKLGVTRQEAKRILGSKRPGFLFVRRERIMHANQSAP
jgi:hypothetical protein